MSAEIYSSEKQTEKSDFFHVRQHFRLIHVFRMTSQNKFYFMLKPVFQKSIIILFLLISLISAVYSQNAIEKKVYTTAPAIIPPLIDGTDNDECWKSVDWAGNFVQTHPQENQAPSQRTEFKMVYDNSNLYVFVRAYDNEPSKISRLMSRRDNVTGDFIEVDIDSYFDKQTAFSFYAMASGAKGDAVITMDGQDEDDSWNPVWFLKTTCDDKGWCAEMKIPLNQLRFGRKDEQIWGIQVSRQIFRIGEMSAWQFIPKGSPGIIHLYGEMHGIKNIVPKRHIELLPYGLGKVERFEKVGGNPFLTGHSSGYSAGLDGKVGVTNDFTLDFTINPDFGQVEADPSEVNLTAFETYFSEKRPFFIEGRNIYQFCPNQTIVIHDFYSDNLFYSRRIGQYPHYYPSVTEGENVRMPEATTILGAAKLSGKTKKGLSVGVLESITSNENAIIDSNGQRRKESVEPLTSYFVGRVQQDFNKGETVIGGIVTAVNRDITNPALDYLPTAAYTGGIDFQHNWKERTWYVAGNAEFSNVRGKEDAITVLQRSSARYYQRPDQKYLTVDSSRTSLSGLGGTVKFGRSSQKRLQFETSMTFRSPGLEFNDLGYMRYSDIIHHGTWVAYYIRNPFAIFNNFYLNTNYWMYWNFSGKLLSVYSNMNFNTQFKNRWRLNGSFTRSGESTDVKMLRGGPAFITPGTFSSNLNIGSDQAKKIYFNIGGYRKTGDAKSSRVNAFWATFNARPLNSLTFSVAPEYQWEDDRLQYISTSGSEMNPVYIFGRMNMKMFDVTFRINCTINPELTIEYYGQPFISAGRYTGISKITDPVAGRYSDRYRVFSPEEISFDRDNNVYNVDENLDGSSDYSFGNPDFNFRQFRSNLVIRWEYHPGSTLYLVWSQGRTSSDTNGFFSYQNDTRELFRIVPHNVFLVKFSYWFTL